MDLCLATDWRPVSRLANRWWEQNGLDLEGINTSNKKTERTEGEEEIDRKETDTDK